jgi:hypothetical protein
VKLRKVRCYVGFAEAHGRYNIEVFYTMPDMYWIRLFTCTACGEVYAMDTENPAFAGKTSSQIAGEATCPRCGSRLDATLQPYPENFRTGDGRIGHFDPGRRIPPDSESIVKEVLELE